MKLETLVLQKKLQIQAKKKKLDMIRLQKALKDDEKGA